MLTYLFDDLARLACHVGLKRDEKPAKPVHLYKIILNLDFSAFHIR